MQECDCEKVNPVTVSSGEEGNSPTCLCNGLTKHLGSYVGKFLPTEDSRCDRWWESEAICSTNPNPAFPVYNNGPANRVESLEWARGDTRLDPNTKVSLRERARRARARAPATVSSSLCGWDRTVLGMAKHSSCHEVQKSGAMRSTAALLAGCCDPSARCIVDRAFSFRRLLGNFATQCCHSENEHDQSKAGKYSKVRKQFFQPPAA